MAKQPGTVDAILRAFAILEHLAESRDGASVTELAVRESVNRALTHRALTSLMHAGYVVQDERSDRYRLTPRLLALAMGYYDSLGLRGVAGPIMQVLADATGCNAEFSRFMDGDLRLLMWVPPARPVSRLQLVSRPGAIQAAHATAAGKVWLASLGEAELGEFLGPGPLPRLGPRTIVDPAALAEELAVVRSRGYATNQEEDGEGFFAVAVPVAPDGEHSLIGSLGLTHPLAGIEEIEMADLVAAAREAANTLAEVLPRGHELTGLAAGRSF